MLPSEFPVYLASRRAEVDLALDKTIAVTYPEVIYESMRYSLLIGGKRLRPILCLAACELLGGDRTAAMPTACALEMVHTMSLIHDDLPAMDNDDLRRGKPTNHKVYGEAIAILAGDALLSYAFEWVASQTHGVDAAVILQVIQNLGHAFAATGVIGGQVVDLACEGRTDVDLETLHYIHTHKTGALLEACVTCGALLGGGQSSDLAHLATYAQSIGLAFQIVDDILDVTASSEQLGKTPGKDQAAQKVTYPSLWGLEASRQKAQELVAAAKNSLQDYGDAADPLKYLADYIVERDR
jgi:geranylgeranyl diphosphate synthase type II